MNWSSVATYRSCHSYRPELGSYSFGFALTDDATGGGGGAGDEALGRGIASSWRVPRNHWESQRSQRRRRRRHRYLGCTACRLTKASLGYGHDSAVVALVHIRARPEVRPVHGRAVDRDLLWKIDEARQLGRRSRTRGRHVKPK